MDVQHEHTRPEGQSHRGQEVADFSYSAAANDTARDQGVSVRIAQRDEVERIREVQAASPAEESLHLSGDQIESLVNNNQVLVASVLHDEQPKIAGAIFFHCSNEPPNYPFVTDAGNHSLSGKNLYDFWIITDKDHRRAPDGTVVAANLIRASKELADEIGVEGVRAYSRPGHAVRTVASRIQEFQLDDFREQVNANPAYKGVLLLHYVLSTRAKGEPTNGAEADLPFEPEDEEKRLKLELILMRENSRRSIMSSSVEPFLDWIADNHPEAISPAQRSEIISLNPDTSWNPTEDNGFVERVGHLYRAFVDEGQFVPIDPTLGGFHTRLGARLHRIRIDSRPGDFEALQSNVEMAYD